MLRVAKAALFYGSYEQIQRPLLCHAYCIRSVLIAVSVQWRRQLWRCAKLPLCTAAHQASARTRGGLLLTLSTP